MGGGAQLSAAEWARPELLFAFLDELRGLGFNLGTTHYGAAEELLLVLLAEGRPTVAGDLPWQRASDGAEEPERLARLLGPVLCSTPREQEDLPRLIALWAAGPGRLLSESLAARDRSAADEQVSRPDRDAGRLAAEPRGEAEDWSLAGTLKRIERGKRVWLVPTTVVLLVVGLGALHYYQVLQDLGPAPAPRQAPGLPGSAPGWPMGWLLAAAGAIAGGYLSWRLWLRMLGRQFLVRRSATAAPAIENLTIRAASDELFAPQALRRSGEQLRRRVALPGHALDMEATVERTARAGGWPTPVAGRQLVRPEYLVLIERASPGDQRSRFFDELSERLKRQGVVLERAYFDGDPRTCFRTSRREIGTAAASTLAAALVPAPGGPTAQEAADTSTPASVEATAATAATPLGLRELYSRYPEHRLLLISSGEGLFSPISGEEVPWIDQLLAWKQRAVLVPRPVAAWGRRERELARRFAVVPATLAGWAALAATFEGQMSGALRSAVAATAAAGAAAKADGEVRAGAPLPEEIRSRPLRWLERNPPEPWRVEQVLDELESSLGEAGFYWLAACAVYPALDWEMTVALGQMLKGDDGEWLYDPHRLEALLELPWLRHGRMPDWLRQSLLARLPRRRESAVRAALEALLLSALERGDARANGAFALEMAGRHPRALARLWRPVWQRLARRPGAEGAARDYVFRGFMAGRRRHLAVALPERVARLLGRRRRGSARGEVVDSPAMRRARRAMGALLVMGPVGILCLDFSLPKWVQICALALLGPGLALAAVAYLWRSTRLMVIGIYWSAAAILNLWFENHFAFKSVMVAFGLIFGHRIGPLFFVQRTLRLGRIRLLLGLASANYLACFALLTVPVSPVWAFAACLITIAVGWPLLALAYCERLATLIFAAGALATPFFVSYLNINGTTLRWTAVPLLLVGLAACIKTWLDLRRPMAIVRSTGSVVANQSRQGEVSRLIGAGRYAMSWLGSVLNNQWALLFMLLFVVRFGLNVWTWNRSSADAFAGLFTVALVTSMIYSATLLSAVYAKRLWSARKQRHGRRSVTTYCKASILGAGIAFAIDLIYIIIARRQIIGDWRRLTFETLSSLKGFGLAFMVLWMTDDKLTIKWSRNRLRWMEGLIAGGGLALVHLSLIMFEGWYKIVTLNRELVGPFSLYTFGIGFVAGFMIPTWYRDRPLGRWRIWLEDSEGGGTRGEAQSRTNARSSGGGDLLTIEELADVKLSVPAVHQSSAAGPAAEDLDVYFSELWREAEDRAWKDYEEVALDNPLRTRRARAEELAANKVAELGLAREWERWLKARRGSSRSERSA